MSTTAPDPNADVESFTYEDARDELVRVVGELEQGSLPLEASLALWERGEALADRCEAYLTGARERLEAARRAKSEPAAAALESPNGGVEPAGA